MKYCRLGVLIGEYMYFMFLTSGYEATMKNGCHFFFFFKVLGILILDIIS